MTHELYVDRTRNGATTTEVLMTGTLLQCRNEMKHSVACIEKAGRLLDDAPDIKDPVLRGCRFEQSVFSRLMSEDETHTKFIVTRG